MAKKMVEAEKELGMKKDKKMPMKKIKARGTKMSGAKKMPKKDCM